MTGRGDAWTQKRSDAIVNCRSVRADKGMNKTLFFAWGFVTIFSGYTAAPSLLVVWGRLFPEVSCGRVTVAFTEGHHRLSTLNFVGIVCVAPTEDRKQGCTESVCAGARYECAAPSGVRG